MSKLIIILLFLSTGLTAQNTEPNVLFILADDLGINALNCYGNEVVESPNIDRLYKEGMHFTNGYSNDPTCAPSRASIMTGQHAPRTNIYRVVDRYKIAKNAVEMRKHMRYLPPPSNHLYSNNNGLNPETFNIAKAFKQSGYKTAAYGKWHLGMGTSAMQNAGFDDAIETKGHYGFKSVPAQTDYNNQVYNADYCTEKGIEFMANCVEQQKPFFLYMPYYLVHAPFEPKAKYVEHFSKKVSGTKYDHSQVIDVLAMIKSLDDSVGELMEALKKLGVDNNTIVIFTSDNGHYRVKGNNMFALPYKGNKGDVWEGGIRVPYIFKWKGKIEPAGQSSMPIIHVDILPTLTDLLDLTLKGGHELDGVSIKTELLGKKQKKRNKPLVWFYTNYSGFNSKTKEFQSKWVNVILDDNYKLLEDVETNTYELYKLDDDPLETKNILTKETVKAQLLIRKLEEAKIKHGLPKSKLNPEYEH
ncbi:hypothetical protein E9993_20785 [Labilibacter sediminis]|nr:hypothetical protein E9993_20785 [Labilibacter sediminis]